MLPLPTISTGIASLICVGFTLIYVAGFYLFKTPGSRNDPPVIRARMKAVSVASLASAAVVWAVLYYRNSTDTFLQVLGLKEPDYLSQILNLFRPLLLTAMLFLGPLSVLFFDQELPFQKHFSFERDVKEVFTSVWGQRNYVVAPLTEEFVFRACIIAVLHQANYSRDSLIFISPLYFGIAHLHHAWDNYNNMGRTNRALKNALFSSLFQFAYTTIFGWYASYLFLRLGSLWPPVFCHSFCNMMGFPDLSYINHRSALQKSVIYMCFPIGICLFIYNFQTLTDPSFVGGSTY